MENKYLNIIGLAYRARKVTTGEDLIVKDIQANRVKLVLLAKDASDRTKKQIVNKCTFYEVPYIEVDDREALGQAIGKPERVAIAITEGGFAKKLQSLLL